jgi:hypothetical protein
MTDREGQTRKGLPNIPPYSDARRVLAGPKREQNELEKGLVARLDRRFGYLDSVCRGGAVLAAFLAGHRR